MILLAFLPLTVGLYCILALALRVPAFTAARAFTVKKDKRACGNLLEDIVKKLGPHLPMDAVKENELQKLLDAACIQEAPRIYLTRIYVKSALTLLLIPVALPLHPIVCVLPLVLCWFVYNHAMEALKKSGDKRKNEIEKEMPRFVSYMANALKTERNIISCMDIYRANYQTPLTGELAITTADMRTGNAEAALQRLERRVNSPHVSQLVRGLLSSMRGNDMSTYFENLSYELTNVWEQRLRAQALRKEPQISRMSYILFGLSLLTVAVVLGVSLFSASSIFGGL